MSQKHRKFSPEFKAKVVLELLEENATLNEIASKYNVLPKSLQQWKKQFVQNASSAFENSVSRKQYKGEIEKKENQIDALSKALGQTVIERDWLSKKVKSLGLSKKESLMEPKLNNLSIIRQCELIKLNRSNLYYKAGINQRKEDLLEHINSIYKEVPIYESSQSTSAVTIGWL